MKFKPAHIEELISAVQVLHDVLARDAERDWPEVERAIKATRDFQARYPNSGKELARYLIARMPPDDFATLIDMIGEAETVADQLLADERVKH